MHIHKQESGIVYILISDTELTRFTNGGTVLQENDPKTRAAIKRILKIVRNKERLPVGRPLTVEAVPTDGGYLLLITPPPTPPANDGIYIFAPKSETVLPQIAAVCQQGGNDIAAASLYAYGDAYRLLLYTPHISADGIARLTEFAPFVGGGKIAAAHITEHGTPLFMGNALESV